MSIYIYIYIYIYTHTHRYVYTSIHVCVSVCVRVCVLNFFRLVLRARLLAPLSPGPRSLVFIFLIRVLVIEKEGRVRTRPASCPVVYHWRPRNGEHQQHTTSSLFRPRVEFDHTLLYLHVEFVSLFRTPSHFHRT